MVMKRPVSILIVCIILLSIVASVVGLTMQGEGELTEFQSVHGETVTLHGKGLYQYDSVSVAAQGRAADFITLFIAIPLLIISCTLTGKGSLRGGLMLTGTLGYLLYTYMSYTFLWMYNPLFILYVALMSMSFFAFTLCLLEFNLIATAAAFTEKLPVRLLGGFQYFLGAMIGLLWLAKIAPTLSGNAVPEGLEHYTTLVIQGMDLGFVVPAAFLSGALLMRRHPFGYLLSSVMLFKGVTMLTAITAMIINMVISGVQVSMIELVMFPGFNLLAIGFLAILLINIDQTKWRGYHAVN